MLADLLGEREREPVHVPRQRLAERPPEQVALIQRPDGGASLVGSAHRSAQPTVISSLGTEVRISGPSEVT